MAPGDRMLSMTWHGPMACGDSLTSDGRTACGDPLRYGPMACGDSSASGDKGIRQLHGPCKDCMARGDLMHVVTPCDAIPCHAMWQLLAMWRNDCQW